MSQDHVPPQLSSDGEQLLADVLRRRAQKPHDSQRRNMDGHRDTPAARANRARRERDPLRVPPELPANDRNDLAGSSDDDTTSRRVVLGLGLVAAAIGAIALFSSLSPDPTVATEVAGATQERVATTGAPVSNVPETPTVEESLVARSVPELDDTGSVITAADQVGAIDVTSIEITVYDEDPAVEGVYSFALRVKSLATESEIDTNSFVVVIVDDDDVEAQTFSRFIHGTLPVGSSALATVRAEGAGPGQQYVVVRLDDVELARIPIGL